MSNWQCLLHKVKTQYLHFRLHANYFFYLERFLKKLADDQCSARSKGSIYHIKHMYMQSFTAVVDWPVLNVKLKYLLCFIFADTAFLCGKAYVLYHNYYWHWLEFERDFKFVIQANKFVIYMNTAKSIWNNGWLEESCNGITSVLKSH